MTETDSGTGLRLLLLVLGFWLIMRSVSKDSNGLTLIDRIVGNKSSNSPLLATGSGAIGTLGSATTGVASGVASGATGVSSAGTGAAAGIVSVAGNVVSVLFSGKRVQVKRRDQGRDLQAPANSVVEAPGSGYLIANKSDPTGFGDSYPVVHFTSGPWAGEDIYFGHTRSLLSSPNQSFTAGQGIAQTQNGSGPYVGNATGLPGWAEIGLAPGGTPGPMGQPLPAGL